MPKGSEIKPIMIDTPIIIDEWEPDEAYDGVFPKGARDKSAYFSPKTPGMVGIKADHRYLFKLSRHWCPWQFWMEIIAYRLGLLMGVPVPPAHIGMSRTYEPDKDTYGALIEWFFDDRKDEYREGGHFMMQVVQDYDDTAMCPTRWPIPAIRNPGPAPTRCPAGLS